MENKPSTFKPKRDGRVQVANSQTEDGETVYFLHNPDAHTYVQIDSQNYFLWELMDGEHELAALAMTYYSKYNSLPFDRLDQLIPQLEANFLLEGISPMPEPQPLSRSASRIKRFADNAFQREFNWHDADNFYTRLYQRLGWVFFTRPALILMGLIAATGFVCFIYLLAAGEYHMFRVNDSYGLGILVLLIASFIVLFWHESGHGLACKSFGRRIRKAGMMFYYGNPAFFIDVSDMWMAPRGHRIWVSLAGPAVNMLVGSILAIITILLPPSTAAQVLFVSAFAAYLNTISNLNPLLELDGYYVLIDLLQTKQLRKKSFEFVKKDLLSKIRRRESFTREEITYSIYGLLALAFTVLTVLISIYLWKRELQLLIEHLVTGEDVLLTVLVGGLTLAAGTWLIVGLISRLVVRMDQARNKRKTISGE
jgi:putative peptide zinc metalloprotease protein